MTSILLAVSVVGALWCYSVARQKGLNLTLWPIISVLAGPLGDPFTYFAKRQISAHRVGQAMLCPTGIKWHHQGRR